MIDEIEQQAIISDFRRLSLEQPDNNIGEFNLFDLECRTITKAITLNFTKTYSEIAEVLGISKRNFFVKMNIHHLVGLKTVLKTKSIEEAKIKKAQLRRKSRGII